MLVTHEQEEAFHLGDRVAVLNQGRMEQVGAPTDLYRRPATPFVASFIGRSSALRGVVDEVEGDRVWVRVGEGGRWWGRAHEKLAVGAEVDFVVRPESVVEASTGESGEASDSVPGTVAELRFTGPLTYALIDLDDDLGRIEMRVEGEDDPTGRRIHVTPGGLGPAPSLFRVR